MWPGYLGLFLVSVSVLGLEKSHIIRRRKVPLDLELNGTFRGGIRITSDGGLQLAPTENPNSEKHLPDDSSNAARPRDVATSRSRRHRQNNRESGLSD